MTMPGTDFSNQNVYWGPQLQSAISNGQVKQSRLDDMVKRILASWYLLGQDKGYPSVQFNSWKIGNKDVGECFDGTMCDETLMSSQVALTRLTCELWQETGSCS
jgi:hypothetical protein